jgi:hypothetical protein
MEHLAKQHMGGGRGGAKHKEHMMNKLGNTIKKESNFGISLGTM